MTNRCSLLLIVVAASLPSCGAFAQSCTDMGCMDALQFTVTTTDGSWPQGEYEIIATTEQSSESCTLTVPEDPTEATTLGTLGCESASKQLFAQLEKKVACEETTTAQATSQNCVPVPGEYQLVASIPKAPASITFELLRDGTSLLSESQSPEYVSFYPNGKSCGPVCQGATLEFQLP